MRWGVVLWLAALAVAGARLDALGSQSDPILINPVRYKIQTGRHSRLATFKVKLQEALDACGARDVVVAPVGAPPDGQLNSAVQKGIRRLADCPVLRDLGDKSGVRKGLVTVGVWQAVMGDSPVPTVDERTMALVLSFEATDFGDAPEWNLCQDGTRARFGPSHRSRGAFHCYNASDPCSFMTWGPRGATAGSGREIQHILWMAMQRDPDLVKRAFGDEYEAMLRFLSLQGAKSETCDGAVPLKTFICAVWIDGKRRQLWEAALAALGHAPVVREAYLRLYTFREFDGSKLEEFYGVWSKLGLVPTEVDYAFFVDRITHVGGPPDDDDGFVEALSKCLAYETQSLTPNAGARRCVARVQPHKTQAELRLARDVAFYLDGYEGGVLSKHEIEAWGRYVPLSAVFNFALSDTVAFGLPTFESITSLGPDRPQATSTLLTPAEIAACPASVLTPARPRGAP